MEEISIGSYMAVISIVYAVIISLFFITILIRKIGLWGIFSKAGEKEWKVMVPFYNQITLLKICKLSPWFIILYIDFLIPIVGFLLGRDVTWALILVSIGFICYRFLISIKLGMSFKKGDAFAFFMALFPTIFYPIIGCSKDDAFTEVNIEKRSKKKSEDK